MAKLAAIERSDARLVARRWADLGGRARITLHDGDVHYLTALALATDDDLVAHLLLAKLRVAAKVSNDGSLGVARVGSLVEFDDGSGTARVARLMHPTAPYVPHGMSVTSLLGTGLIGLGEGQATPWPDERGDFHPLKILRIAGADASDANFSNGKEKQ